MSPLVTEGRSGRDARRTPLARVRRRLLYKAPKGEFWIFYTGGLFVSIGLTIFFFLFNLYLLDLGYTEGSMGKIGSAMAIGCLIGTIPIGMLAERFGVSRVLASCTFLTVSFAVLRSCVTSWPAQIGFAFLMGLTLCASGVCLLPTVAKLTTPRNRPFAFSLIFASGIAIGGVLGGFVAGSLPGWLNTIYLRYANVALSQVAAKRATLLIFCGIAYIAVWFYSRLSISSVAVRVKLPRLSGPLLSRFLPAIAIWSFVISSFAPFINVYFARHLGFPLQQIGYIYSLSQLAQFLSTLLAPLLFRRMGLASGVMWTQLTVAAALGSFSILHTAAQAALIYCIYMAMQAMSEPGLFSLLMDRMPAEERNGASALCFFVFYGVQAVASTCVGAALVRFGYPPVLALIACLAMATALLFHYMSRLPQPTGERNAS